MEAMGSRTDAPSPFQNPGSATGSALAVILNIQRVQLTTDAWWRVFIQWVCTCSGQFWYLQYFTIIVSFGSAN